jgi:hypothetical protein
MWGNIWIKVQQDVKDILPGRRNPGPDLFPFPHRQPDPWVVRTFRPKK